MGTAHGAVVSVNVGVERPIAAKGGTSGIDERPVAGPVVVRAPGPKGVGGSGLVGDHISDTAHHGGDDQAVYACAREDLDAWAAELGRSLPSGTFGELTTTGVEVSGAVIGDAVRVLDVPGHGVDVGTAFAALTTRPELLALLRAVPQLPAEDREVVQRRLRN